jgi:DNA-binding LacI/PurR family transcriptional regulator
MEKFVKKHLRLAALLEERIARGDYALVGFPGVRDIAAEAGVSIMTAHNAVQHLIQKGVVDRRVPGRAKAGARRRSTKTFTIGIVMPPSSTGYLWAWQAEIEAATTACGATVREVICRNWNDALLGEALRGFDGVFVLQFPDDEVPPHTQELITSSGTPLVSLDHDLVALEIPSLLAFPPGCCQPLLDHFHALGHRRIGCINNLPEVADIRLRIGEWQAWMAEKRLTGPLINEPSDKMRTFQEMACQAHDSIVARVKSGGLDATAVMCTTIWTALGVLRGLQECGLVVGRDVSVGAINDEGMAELVYPTLTAIRLPDVTAQLKKCVRWMMRGGKWQSPLLMKSAVDQQLYIGQSSGAPRK